MVTAEEIAASRPPDEVVRGEWEPDPESRETRREQVAIEWTMFKVLRYREYTYPIWTRDRRLVREVWRTPGRIVTDAPDITVYLDPATPEELTIKSRYEPASVVERGHWEYRSHGG